MGGCGCVEGCGWGVLERGGRGRATQAPRVGGRTTQARAHRDANLSVLCVSSAWAEAGVMVQITATRAPVPAGCVGCTGEGWGVCGRWRAIPAPGSLALSCPPRPAPPTRQAGLQQAGEFGITEGDVGCAPLRQLVDDCTQGEERLVDERALQPVGAVQLGLGGRARRGGGRARARVGVQGRASTRWDVRAHGRGGRWASPRPRPSTRLPPPQPAPQHTRIAPRQAPTPTHPRPPHLGALRPRQVDEIEGGEGAPQARVGVGLRVRAVRRFDGEADDGV